MQKHGLCRKTTTATETFTDN